MHPLIVKYGAIDSLEKYTFSTGSTTNVDFVIDITKDKLDIDKSFKIIIRYNQKNNIVR